MQGTTTLEEVKKQMAMKRPPGIVMDVITPDGTPNSILDSTKPILDRLSKLRLDVQGLAICRGGFGDVQDCDGIVDEAHNLPEGGLVTRFMGCSYWFKGYPYGQVVEGLGIPKAMVSAIPRHLFAKSYYWITAIALRYIFARKRLIHDLHIWINILHGHSVLKVNFDSRLFNKPVREVRRVVDKVLEDRLLKSMGPKDTLCKHCGNGVWDLPLLHRNYPFISKKRELWETIALIADFVYLFLEFDNAYRFRIQDLMENLKKENLKKDTIGEIKRLLNLLIERENPEVGIRYKWRVIKAIVLFALKLNKQIREFVRDVLLELDIDKVKLDKDDWYFCLRRFTYQFRGMPFDQRVKLANRIDKVKNHVRVQFMDQIQHPAFNEGKPLPGVRITQTDGTVCLAFTRPIKGPMPQLVPQVPGAPFIAPPPPGPVITKQEQSTTTT